MDQERLSPVVVFTCRPNSHPFQERHISLHEPIKIGRSVARVHPAPTNAIFDCKVLSRNHALLWFEDGKFYLQDTKSSNGTFVNNQRLSKGSEESDPHEIFSGDIIQFGVDVMENSKRVTHGCIMASVTLYLTDGTEAKQRFSGRSQTPGHSLSALHSQEMYQLSQYLQEALHREQILQDKMAHLQQLLNTATDACDTSWHALINEDRLLSKLEVLQNQLSAYSKNQTDATLKQQIVALEEERLSRETTTKQSLRKVLDEKIQAIQKLSDIERSLRNSEDECKHAKDLYEQSQEMVRDLTERYDTKIMEYSEISQKLQDTEQKLEDDIKRYREEKENIQAKLEEALADKDTLEAKLTHLQTQSEQSNNTKHTGSSRENGEGDADDDDDDEDSKQNGRSFDDKEAEESVIEMQKEEIESLQAEKEALTETIHDLEAKLEEMDKVLEDKDDEIRRLNQQLENTQLEMVEYVTKSAALEEQQRTFIAGDDDEDRVPTLTNTSSIQEDMERVKNSYEETIATLKEELEHLRSSTDPDTEEIKDLREKLAYAQNVTEEMKTQIQLIQDQLNSEQQQHGESQIQVDKLRDELDGAKKDMERQSSVTREYKDKTEALQQKLEELTKSHQEELDKINLDNEKLQNDVDLNRKECEHLRNECNSLRNRVQAIETELQRLQQDNTQLETDVTKTKSHNTELAEEISKLKKTYEELKALKDTLENQRDSMQENLTDTQKEAKLYKEQLDQEKQDKDQLKKKYETSVEDLKQTKDKMEAVQKQHSEVQERLETVKAELVSVREEYSKLSDKSDSVSSFLTSLPMMVLILAVVIVLYPLISRLGATSNSQPL